MSENSLPKHVAFIMDGNGRWAKKRHKARSAGHTAGYGALQKIIAHAFKSGVETISFYAFSTENWSRPKEEVDKLLNAFTEENPLEISSNKYTDIFKGKNIIVIHS